MIPRIKLQSPQTLTNTKGHPFLPTLKKLSMEHSKVSSLRHFSFFPFFLHHCFAFASLQAADYYHYSPSPSPSHPATNPFEFIRSSCNATLYPDVCFKSLSRYANYVRRDPAQLARMAIMVSLARARHTAAFFTNMTRQADYESYHRATSALHDCSSVFGDAVDQIRGSLRELSQLGSLGSRAEAVRFQLSNVQTLMSAALTNEDTCSNGFQDVEECPVKTEVCGKVASVKEVTSNALALVNSFASSVGS